MLVGKTALPIDLGYHTFKCQTPIRVEKGDLLGIHVDVDGGGNSCISHCRNQYCPNTVMGRSRVIELSDNGWTNGFILDMSSAKTQKRVISLKAYCT